MNRRARWLIAAASLSSAMTADGWSAARIEEEVVVTADGCALITKFPAEELLVPGRKYWTAGGALGTLRESQSHLNTPAGRGEALGGAGGVAALAGGAGGVGAAAAMRPRSWGVGNSLSTFPVVTSN